MCHANSIMGDTHYFKPGPLFIFMYNADAYSLYTFAQAHDCRVPIVSLSVRVWVRCCKPIAVQHTFNASLVDGHQGMHCWAEARVQLREEYLLRCQQLLHSMPFLKRNKSTFNSKTYPWNELKRMTVYLAICRFKDKKRIGHLEWHNTWLVTPNYGRHRLPTILRVLLTISGSTMNGQEINNRQSPVDQVQSHLHKFQLISMMPVLPPATIY